MICIGCTQIYLFTYLDADNSRRKDIARTASPGQTVLLPCVDLPANTNITREWQRHSHHGHPRQRITHNRVVTSEFNDRFHQHRIGLEIKNVQRKDEGVYTCFDPQHHDRELRIRLYVPRKSICNGFCCTLHLKFASARVSYMKVFNFIGSQVTRRTFAKISRLHSSVMRCCIIASSGDTSIHRHTTTTAILSYTGEVVSTTKIENDSGSTNQREVFSTSLSAR